MQNIIPDERYSVADEAILGAFFKLVKEKKPDRITVSDITKTAGIARSTFYNHYQDVPSLIAAVEDKTIHDVFSMMENFQPKNDRDICSSYFLTLCRYTMENPFLSGLLSTPHGNDLFEKMLTMLHHYVTETTSNSRPDRHTKEEVSYVITCAIGSTIGVLHKWSRDNFNLAPEVIADILSEILKANAHYLPKPEFHLRQLPVRDLHTPYCRLQRKVRYPAVRHNSPQP
jgi:AcrR family transcriptional regulator